MANKSWLKKGHDWQISYGSRKNTIGKQVMAQERARLANKSYSSRKGTIGKQVMAQEKAQMANKS